MTTKRMTGKDYAKEFQDLESKRRSLKAITSKRLYELVIRYPNVDLPCSRAGGLKSGEISSEWLIDDMNIDSIIKYIVAIEKYIADKYPHKQTEISFPETQHKKLMNIAKAIQAINIKECMSVNSPDGKHHFVGDNNYCYNCGKKIKNNGKI